MAHKDWCGRTCAECVLPCRLDESIPCSPDCPYLGKNGEMNHVECSDCGVYLIQKKDDFEDCNNWLSDWLFD